jgi:hypothetical protein
MYVWLYLTLSAQMSELAYQITASVADTRHAEQYVGSKRSGVESETEQSSEGKIQNLPTVTVTFTFTKGAVYNFIAVGAHNNRKERR